VFFSLKVSLPFNTTEGEKEVNIVAGYKPEINVPNIHKVNNGIYSLLGELYANFIYFD